MRAFADELLPTLEADAARAAGNERSCRPIFMAVVMHSIYDDHHV